MLSAIVFEPVSDTRCSASGRGLPRYPSACRLTSGARCSRQSSCRRSIPTRKGRRCRAGCRRLPSVARTFPSAAVGPPICVLVASRTWMPTSSLRSKRAAVAEQADVVAENGVRVRGDVVAVPLDQDSVGVEAPDVRVAVDHDVPVGHGAAADDVRVAGDKNPRLVRRGGRAVGLDTEGVTDDLVAVRIDLERGVGLLRDLEVAEGKRADRRAARACGQDEALDTARDLVVNLVRDCAAVDRDDVALGRPVDRDGSGDRGKRLRQLNRLRPAPRDREPDLARVGVPVRARDRVGQRARRVAASVDGVGGRS